MITLADGLIRPASQSKQLTIPESTLARFKLANRLALVRLQSFSQTLGRLAFINRLKRNREDGILLKRQLPNVLDARF